MNTFKTMNVKSIKVSAFNGHLTTAKNTSKRDNESVLFCLINAYEHNNTQPFNKFYNAITTQVKKRLFVQYINSLDLTFIKFDSKAFRFDFINEKIDGFNVFNLLPFSEFEAAKAAKAEKAKKAKAKEQNAHKAAVIEQRKVTAVAEETAKQAKAAEEKAAKAKIIAEKSATAKAVEEAKAAEEKAAKAKELAEEKAALIANADKKAISTKIEYLNSLGKMDNSAIIKSLELIAHRGIDTNDTDDLKTMLGLTAIINDRINELLANTVPSHDGIDSDRINELTQLKASAKEKGAKKKVA